MRPVMFQPQERKLQKNPNKNIISTAWKSLECLATLAGVTDAVAKICEIINSLF